MRLLRRTTIDFLSLRLWAAALSLFIIGAGLLSIALHGGVRLGIDFAGGSQVIVRFDSAPDVTRLREALTRHGLASTQVQEFDGADEVMIRTALAHPDDDIEAELRAALGSLQSPGGFEIISKEWVGPQVGEDLRRQAQRAIIWSLLGMLAYITYRFDLRFGVAAIVALLHDVLVVVTAFSITGREFNLTVIAAILTIVGYSLNDTVVIFDRLREINQTMRGMSLYERINLSVNQTLSRTLLTSATTLLVVLSLYFLGGPMINDFAFAMLVGVIAGTYSTVFIANPVVYYWDRLSHRRDRAVNRPFRTPAAAR